MIRKPFFACENIANQKKGANSRVNEKRVRIVLTVWGLCFVYSCMPELATRFVELDESIDEFIETQCNRNTLNKTHKDISLLKKLLSSQNEERKI
jgi:hypothetical protein